jgi:hypothetical protein
MKTGIIWILLLFLSACGSMSDLEYKKKRMLKQDRKMYKQVQKSRRCQSKN